MSRRPKKNLLNPARISRKARPIAQKAFWRDQDTWVVQLPILTRSESNVRGWWGTKAAFVRGQRGAVGLAMRLLIPKDFYLGVQHWRVTLTRIGTRKLDEPDNLGASLKAVKDEVAAAIGIDDGHARIKWKIEQQVTPASYGVLVRLERWFPPSSSSTPEPNPLGITSEDSIHL